MQSLPVQPVESGALWYANSRLAYQLIAMKVWYRVGNTDEIVFKVIVWVSRVIEKTAAFAYSLLRDACTRLGLQKGNMLQLFGDCAVYWRSLIFMGTAMVNLQAEFGIDVSYCHHLEQHGKTDIDGPYAIYGKNKKRDFFKTNK